MANDRALGGAILLGSIAGILIYGVLLYFWATLILEITAFLGVVVLLGILGWIGWTMATTPPPEPMPDIGAAAQPAAAAGAKTMGEAEKKPSG
ncbi:MAG: transcriptional regulator [Thaumarchaeota archaeon]|nr:transcriptional regulator [Nitrososphaerota archaeon]